MSVYWSICLYACVFKWYVYAFIYIYIYIYVC